MRKLFWAFSGLTLPVTIVLLSRGPLGAGQPEPAIPDSLRQAGKPIPSGHWFGSSATITAPGVQAGYVAATQPATRRQVAAPRSPFAVKPDSGLWMICAAHYTGPYAAYLADQVVQQLRGRHINCFIFNYADEHRRKENEENMRRLHENPDGFRPRFTRVEEQCAVLIGGFKDMESARKALPTVKKLAPPKVLYPNGEEACEHLMEYGEREDASMGKAKKNPYWAQKVNPFERSFVIRNPVAPREEADMSKRVDPLWKKLNQNEPFSLLRCKKNYTILVKCYQGNSEVVSPDRGGKPNRSILGTVGFAKSGPDVMQGIGVQAHALAQCLRGCHLEAYVLHTRQGSLVTIGGFDSLEDEELKQLQDKLGKLRLMPQSGGPHLAPGQEDIFELLPNPMPMPIPKL